jgi:Tol biopolymer transport system component/outer membrane protein assembly factor BamD (BamD/ComL family)
MVTGRLPYDAETPFAIVMKHITEPLPLPRSIRPELPEAVERVILKAMAKDPDARFTSAGELAEAVRLAVSPARPTQPATRAETLEEQLARLPNLYTQALGYFYTEQWNKAIENLEAIVSLQPEYEQGDAARRLEQAREQLQLAELYIQAQAALEGQNWSMATTYLNEIVVADAGYRDAAGLLKHARGKQALDDLYEDAQRLYDSRQWHAVISVWERIHALDPNYPDPDNLLTSARTELEKLQAAQAAERQAKERAHRLTDLYRRGLEHVAADDWQEAVHLFEQIESVEPGYQETPALLERSRRELTRQHLDHDAVTEVDIIIPQSAKRALPAWLKHWPYLTVAIVGLAAVFAVVLVFVSSSDDAPSDVSSGAATLTTELHDLLLVSDRDGKREIYRIDASGQVKRWTYSPGASESWAPALGPDNVLYFTSNRDGKREIYRMAKTGEVQRWTFSSGDSESWAPVLGTDGVLYFTSNRDGKPEIYRIDEQGEVVRWTFSPGDSGSWMETLGSDGTLYLVSDREDKREIYRMDTGGSVVRWTYSPGASESWAPALGPDDVLYFTSNRDGKREVYRIAKSGEVQRWTFSPGDSESWAPTMGSNDTLFFTSDRDGRPEIYSVDRTGQVKRVTQTPGEGGSWLPDWE